MLKKIAVAFAVFTLLFTATRLVQLGPNVAHAAMGDVVKAILWDATGKIALGTATNPIKTAGSLTTNNAAPVATNVGVLPGVANNAAPSYVEGNQVLLSIDLVGRTRISGTTANDTNNIGNSLETLPGVARAAPTSITAGRSEKLEQDAPTGAVYVAQAATTSITGFTNVSISATASVSVKASAGNLYGYVANNGQATICWLQCVNSAGAGTLGTAPIISFPLPLSTSQGVSLISPIPLGNFSTGIACGFSTAAGGNTACGVASPATLLFK